MIGLNDHNRALPQAERVDLCQQLADPLVHRPQKRRVKITRMFERGITREPLGVALQWVMRSVDGEVQEERPVSIPLEKPARFLDHQIAEESPGELHFTSVAKEVVAVRTAPVNKMRIIVDTPTHVAERKVETLRRGHRFGAESQVPLADQPGGVPGRFEHLGDREFPPRHSANTRIGRRIPKAFRHGTDDGP